MPSKKVQKKRTHKTKTSKGVGTKGKQHGSDVPDAAKKDGDDAEPGDDDDDIFDRVSLETSLRTEMAQQHMRQVATYVHRKVGIPHKNNTKWPIVV